MGKESRCTLTALEAILGSRHLFLFAATSSAPETFRKTFSVLCHVCRVQAVHSQQVKASDSVGGVSSLPFLC